MVLNDQEELPVEWEEGRAFHAEGTVMQTHGGFKECSWWQLPVSQDCWGRKFRKRQERCQNNKQGQIKKGLLDKMVKFVLKTIRSYGRTVSREVM